MDTKKISWEQAVQWLRNQPEKSELVEACYFDDPLSDAAERFSKSLEWRELKKIFPSVKGEALDLGAGRGIASYALAKDGWRVTALEPDPSYLVGAGAIRNLAKSSGFNIQVVTDYSENLPFNNESFELVNCRQALHHANNLTQTCNEIFRVLKKGSVMVASREHVISKKKDLDQFLDSHPLHNLYGGENAYLLKEYLDAFYEAGFETVKVYQTFDSPINYFPMTEKEWILICLNKVTNKISEKFVLKIFNNNNMIGRFFVKTLAIIANWRNNSPGRLYTFVAQK